MKSRTVIVSGILHVLVFGLALQVSKSKAARKATSVAIVGEKKKPKTEEKPKPPPPKPKVVASAKPEVSKQAPVEAKPAPEPTNAPAPVETHLEMGNDEPGISLGGSGAAKKGPAPTTNAPKQTAAPVKKEKVLAPKDADNPEEDNCTEAPSKPVPVQKPSEIEYTQEARANNIEGRLVLRVTIGADGSVVKVEVVSSVDPSLDAAAIAAVKTWMFKPSMRCGKAMAGGVFNLARTFELGD